MLVALTGAHSCGKSTLVEFFRGKEGFTCVDSVTRSRIGVSERRIDGVKELDTAQYSILLGIREAVADLIEQNKNQPDQIFLLDRCIFDFVAYTRAFHKRGLVSDKALWAIEQDCQDILADFKYDLVGYLGIEFNIVDDGVRSLDEELRKDVDQEIQRQLLWNPIKAIKLSGSVRQRVDTLRHAIDAVRYSR